MDRQLYKDKLDLMEHTSTLPFDLEVVRELFPYIDIIALAHLFNVQELLGVGTSERLVALPPLYNSNAVHYVRFNATHPSLENLSGARISYEGATQHFSGISYVCEALQYALDNWEHMMDLYTGQLLVEVDLFGASQKLEDIAKLPIKGKAFERVKVFSQLHSSHCSPVYAMYLLLEEKVETLQSEKAMGAPMILPRDDVLWNELITDIPRIRMAGCIRCGYGISKDICSCVGSDYHNRLRPHTEGIFTRLHPSILEYAHDQLSSVYELLAPSTQIHQERTTGNPHARIVEEMKKYQRESF